MERAAAPFFLGLLVGAVLAFGLWVLLDPQEETAQARGVGGGAAAETGDTDPEHAGAALQGRDVPDAEEETSTVVTLSEKGATLLHEMEGSFPDPESLTRSWTLLAQLYAMAGRVADVERVLQAAIEAGAQPHALLSPLSELGSAEALRIFRILEGIDPELFDGAPGATAQFLFDQGDGPGAAAMLRRHLQDAAEPDFEWTQLLLKADPQGAVSFLLGVAEGREGWQAGWYENLADNLVSQERREDALRMALAGLARFPTYDGLLTTLRGLDIGKALDVIDRRLADNPADTAAWIALADIRMSQGDTEAAFRALDEALGHDVNSDWLMRMMEIDPARALPLIARRTETTADDESIGVLAKAHLRNNQPGAAYDVFLRAHRHDPEDPEWLMGMVRIDPRRTLEILEQRVGDAPENVGEELAGNHGRALEALGNATGALRSFRAAWNADNSDMEWALGMARVDPGQAESILQASLEDNEHNAVAMAGLALARSRNGDAGGAREMIEKAAANDDVDVRVYRAWGQIDPAAAEAALQGKLREHPGNASWHAAAGYLAVAQGQRKKARDAFKKALEIGGNNWTWHMEYATLLQETSDR